MRRSSPRCLQALSVRPSAIGSGDELADPASCGRSRFTPTAVVDPVGAPQACRVRARLTALICHAPMSHEQQQLQSGTLALGAQRGLLGDAVVDMAVAPLKDKLAALAAPPAPPAEPTQALKQVSILFLDVVGSTTLAQHLDPEAISAVMDDALTRGTAVVQAHRGKVLQYAGDNILAAFGADESREDDTERAVHCGLAARSARSRRPCRRPWARGSRHSPASTPHRTGRAGAGRSSRGRCAGCRGSARTSAHTGCRGSRSSSDRCDKRSCR